MENKQEQPIEVTLYNGRVVVKRNAQHRYYVSVDGGKFAIKTGMSTFAGVLDKSRQLIPWAVGLAVDLLRENKDLLNNDSDDIWEQAEARSEEEKQKAADIGSDVDEWIRRDVRGLHPDMPVDARVVTGVLAWLDWKEKHQAEVSEYGRIVYSIEKDYVGELDFIAKIKSCGGKCCGGHKKGKKLLILGDVKTSNGVYATYGIQTAGYLEAYREETGTNFDGRLILRLSKETEAEYQAKWEKKNAKRVRQGKEPINDPYKVFEPVWLDNEWLEDDLVAAAASQALYKWKYPAEKRLLEAKK